MLEWYRANATYDAVMADSVVVIAHAAQATGIGRFSFRGRIADPFAEPELLTVAAAFERFAGIDLLATIDGGEGDRAALALAARERVRITDDDTWSDIFSKILVEHVDYHYPAYTGYVDRTVDGLGDIRAMIRSPFSLNRKKRSPFLTMNAVAESTGHRQTRSMSTWMSMLGTWH